MRPRTGRPRSHENTMAAPASAPGWYYVAQLGDQPRGPVDDATAATAPFVWREGMGDWLPPSEAGLQAVARPSGSSPGGWYYQAEDGTVVGPHTAADVRAAFGAGNVDGMTSVWREGMASWVELAQVAELREAVTTSVGQNGVVDDTLVAFQAPPATDSEKRAGAESLSLKRKRQRKPKFVARNKLSIYVSQLPEAISSEEQLASLFEACGAVQVDAATGKKRAKLYLDAGGQPKGDGVVAFVRKESVDLALQLRDGYELPEAPGRPISVERAHFEAKGDVEQSALSKEAKVRPARGPPLFPRFPGLPG